MGSVPTHLELLVISFKAEHMVGFLVVASDISFMSILDPHAPSSLGQRLALLFILALYYM
jgi:hypothetical protein